MTGWDPANDEMRKLLELKRKSQLEGEAKLIVAEFDRKSREEEGFGEKSYMESIASGEQAKIEGIIAALGGDASEEMKTAAVIQYLEGKSLPTGITHYVKLGSGGSLPISLKS